MDKPYSLYPADIITIPGKTMETHRAELNEFCLWLHDLGIDTSKTRIPKYIKFIDNFPDLESFNPDKDDESWDLFNKSLYVLREIHELIWIYNSLKMKLHKGGIAHLKFIVGGNEFAKDDTDTTARNYQLELRIASYFLRAEYNVDLDQVTDIVATTKNDKFLVECKRLSSPKKVNLRIKEAAKQLEIRLRKKGLASPGLGIGVFDVTKIAFPHQGLTWGVTFNQCRDVIQQKLIEIRKAYNFTEPFEANKNVILIWLQIHIPSLNLSMGQSTTRFSSIFIPMVPANGYRAEAFERLRKVIENRQIDL
jgi:hypothetical protein